MAVFNVLFVCIGNSCRSQMAEGFARTYGTDVLQPWSAGLAPASIVQPMTIQVMAAKNINIQDQFPKSIHEMDLNAFDVIANMSGQAMPLGVQANVLPWVVVDPMGQSEEVYVGVRDQIEGLVMQLILDLRRHVRAAEVKPSATPQIANAPRVAPAPAGNATDKAKPADSSKQFGFGRVRRARD